MYAGLPSGVNCTHVGELLVRQHFVEHHERILGCEQPPQVLILPASPLFVAYFLYYNKPTRLASALRSVAADGSRSVAGGNLTSV